MMGRLAGQVAVVTGGTRGLGFSIAKKIVTEGADAVIIGGRDRVRGAAAEASLTALGLGRAVFVEAELGTNEGCQHFCDCVQQLGLRVTTLVNAAGLTARGTIISTTPQLWDRMFAINVRAPFFITQHFVRTWMASGSGGQVVNIGSIAAGGGQPFKSPYAASKGALVTLSKNLAFALMRNRIRVNVVNPGWMPTEGEDAVQKYFHSAPGDWQRIAGKALPFGSLLPTEGVAALVAYLCSPDASHLTGAVIDMDQSVVGAFDTAPVPASAVPLDAGEKAGCPPFGGGGDA